MKKLITFISFTFAISLSISFSQNAPQAFNYQAIVKDATGSIIANNSIDLRISILNNSPSGENLYTEGHSTTTNASGVVNVQIGQGNPITGDFTSIDWANGTKWLEIELATSGTYTVIGSMQLLSVPYALYAASAGTSGPSGTIISCGSYNSNYIVRGDGTGNWVCDDFMQISSNGVGINTSPNSSFDLKVNGNIGIGSYPSSSYDLSVDGNVNIEDYLGIGGSTSSSYELDVDGDVRIQDWLGVGSSTSNSYDVDIDGDMRIQDGLGVGTSPPYSGLYVGSSSNFYIKESINSGSGVPLVISSGEVKKQSYSKKDITNIEPLISSKSQILNLKPRKFNYNIHKGGDGTSDIGLIAEEVELLIPDLVTFDKKSNPIGVKHEKLSLYLLEVIKFQEERISNLEKQILEIQKNKQITPQ